MDEPEVRRRSLLAAGAIGAVSWTAFGARASGEPARGPAYRDLPFDHSWLFGPASEHSDEPDFDDSDFTPVVLPHTVTALPWHAWDPASWERIWCYRRHFDLPAAARGDRAFLHIDAALTGATPTLNGHRLDEHLGGYLPFEREVTGLLTGTGNVLAVRLDSRFTLDVPPNRPAPYPTTSVDFWQPGGLYRSVRLRVLPQVFVADVFAKPVEVLTANRRVEVACTIDAAAVPDGDAEVVVELRDGTRTVRATTVPVTLAPGRTTVTATLTGLTDLALWSVDRPRLYEVVTTLRVDRRPVHEHRTRIGLRDARFTRTGFFLNGRRLQLFGLNRHQFYPYAGAAMPPRVQRTDAEILRHELNCTVVRCSHYPQSEDFLDACDELGLLVWEEAPGWGYLGDPAWKDLAYRDVGDMIRRDRNHPSIVVWGARLNETADDVPFYTRTRDLAHRLDDSRPTAGAMAGRHDTPNYVQDVFAQNDYSAGTGDDGRQRPELMPPRRDLPYLVTEAVGTLSGPAKYYRRTDPQQVQQGQATAHARVHDIGYSDTGYCGVLPWSGYDYPSGTGNQYQGVKYTGVVDLFRIPKPGAAFYQAQTDPRRRPVIAPAFYWDFGITSPVTDLGARAMICANLDRLELYVDGTHHATVRPDTDGYPHLPYPPSFADLGSVDGAALPELRIDGYLDGRRVLTRRFASDPSGDRLSVTVDDTDLVADGADATRVVLRAVDRYGNPRPYVGGEVAVRTTGPIELIGANPFPFAEVGAAGAVWLRTRRGAGGRVGLTATHPTLGTATVRVTVR